MKIHVLYLSIVEVLVSLIRGNVFVFVVDNN